MEWKQTQISEFLFERKGRYKPDDETIKSLKRLEKIDFSGNFFIGKKPSRTDMILIKKGDFVISGINVSKGAMGIYRQKEDITATIHYSSYTFDEDKIDIEYFENFLQSVEFIKLLQEQVKGGIKTEIKAKHLLNLKISLPPNINYQKQIAQKLKNSQDKQNNLKQLIENQKIYLKNLRAQILQDSIEGKLTKDWREQNPDVEPASELLKKIKQEKEKLIAERKLKKPPKIKNSITYRDIKIPKKWNWTKTDELLFVTKLAGFEYTKYIKLKDFGEIPVVRAQNVRPLYLKKHSLKYIDLKTSLMLDRCSLNKNSLLITFIGAGIGDVSYFCEKERWHLAPNVAKAEPFDNCENFIDLKFLNYFLMSVYGQKEIFKHVKATAQPSLSMGTIRDIDLPIPPLEEQKIIVSKLQTLMQKCDEAEKVIEDSLNTSNLLTKSILAEAFNKK